MQHDKLEAAIRDAVKATLSGQIAGDDMCLDVAKRLITHVEEKATTMGVNAVVAVTNRAARIVAVECMDDAFIASLDIATGKAYTAVSLKMATSALKPLAQPGAPLYGVQQTNDGKIVIFGGGVPLYRNGLIVGGLGVSGGTEAEDTALAEYGKQLFSAMI